MMAALLVYSYCVGERSSRRIGKSPGEALPARRRVPGDNRQPHARPLHHSRFRKDNEQAVLSLFGQVLTLCRKAEIANPAVIAIDGTRIKASASLDANRTYASLKKEHEGLARRILAEAERVDAEEDRIYGPGVRGDEVPLTQGRGDREGLDQRTPRRDQTPGGGGLRRAAKEDRETRGAQERR